jgi:hypothetical protein
MGFNSMFKGLKLLKKNPGNGRLNNLNDPVLNVLKTCYSYGLMENTVLRRTLAQRTDVVSGKWVKITY